MYKIQLTNATELMCAYIEVVWGGGDSGGVDDDDDGDVRSTMSILQCIISKTQVDYPFNST